MQPRLTTLDRLREMARDQSRRLNPEMFCHIQRLDKHHMKRLREFFKEDPPENDGYAEYTN